MPRQRFFRFEPGDHPPLEELVVSKANQLAHAALVRLLTDGCGAMNPLVLLGAAGTGKTRLLEGFRASLARRRSAEDRPILDGGLLAAWFQGVPEDRTSITLEERFGSATHLLIDRLEAIPRNHALHRALWNLFNRFHADGRPIVAASRQAPRRLENLDDHLRSRFAWGLMISLEPPDDSARERILQSLARQRSLRLRPEVIRSILARAPRDPVSLERVVAALDALSLEAGRRIDRRLLTEALQRLGHAGS